MVSRTRNRSGCNIIKSEITSFSLWFPVFSLLFLIILHILGAYLSDELNIKLMFLKHCPQ